jgi:hypothetical protein
VVDRPSSFGLKELPLGRPASSAGAGAAVIDKACTACTFLNLPQAKSCAVCQAVL